MDFQERIGGSDEPPLDAKRLNRADGQLLNVLLSKLGGLFLLLEAQQVACISMYLSEGVDEPETQVVQGLLVKREIER